MDSMKNLKKLWMSSLSFLEHNLVYSVIVFVIVIYTLGIFDGINSFIGGLYNYFIIRLIVILLIIWIAPKDPTLAILLALSYAVSLQYMSTSENFVAPIQQEESVAKNMLHHQNKMRLEQFAAAQRDAMNTNVNSGKNVSNKNMDMNKRQIQEEAMMNSKKMNRQMQEEAMMNNKNMNKQMQEEAMNNKRNNTKKNNEHFFPLTRNVQENFFPLMNAPQEQNKNNTPNTPNKSNECMDLYVPEYEAVGNVCSPVATFQGELNAQGLNSPSGFDSSSVGSPLM